MPLKTRYCPILASARYTSKLLRCHVCHYVSFKEYYLCDCDYCGLKICYHCKANGEHNRCACGAFSTLKLCRLTMEIIASSSFVCKHCNATFVGSEFENHVYSCPRFRPGVIIPPLLQDSPVDEPPPSYAEATLERFGNTHGTGDEPTEPVGEQI